MPKKWIVATAALAVVKGKKLTNKRKDKASTIDKHSSSEFSCVSSDSCYNNAKENVHSDESDCYSFRSSDGSRVTASSLRDGLRSNGSNTTDSSSSYGCGTYHRRESLSQSSFSSLCDDDSSFSSRSTSTKFSGLTEPDSEKPTQASLARHNPNECTSCEEEVSINGNPDSLSDPSFSSKTSFKSLVKAMSSKKIAKNADVDDEGSEASSKVSRKSNKSSIGTKPFVSINPSVYDDEQTSMMKRRRSSIGGGRGRGRRWAGQGRGGSVRALKVEGSDSDKEFARSPMVVDDKINTQHYVEVKFSDLLQRVRSQRLPNEASIETDGKTEDLDNNFNVLLHQVRSQSSADQSELLASGLSAKMEARRNETCAGVEVVIPLENSASLEVRDGAGELSYSLKTELLANANSNLRSSVTSIASEESADSLTDETSKKSVGSSRFASMMANLKSSNDSNSNSDTHQSTSFGRDIDMESDDEHIFEAPKIVNERGQSMRSLSNHETSSTGARSGDPQTDTITVDEEDECKRSRFRVHRPLHQLTRGPENNSVLVAQNPRLDLGEEIHNASSGESYSESPVDTGEDGKHSDGSISTASSGDDENAGSVTNLARIRYPEDEENSSDDDLEYYGETAMTILTPITEMGSMESDVETTSHISEASDSDSDEVTVNSRSADQNSLQKRERDKFAFDRGRLDRSKSAKPSDMHWVIESLRVNDPDLKQVKLDDTGLNDSDALKLFPLLYKNTHVTHLSLANNKLGDNSAVYLAKVLSASASLSHICLKGNNIGNHGALELKKVLEVKGSLSHLDITDNDIDSYVMEGLQKSPAVVVPLESITPSSRIHPRLASHLPSGNGALSSDCFPGKMVGACCEGKTKLRLVPEGLCGVPEGLCGGANGVLQGTRAFSPVRENCVGSLIEDKHSDDSISDCSLVTVFDQIMVSNDNHQLAFQDNLSSLRCSDSNTQGETALLLAMSLALSTLDSRWILQLTKGFYEGGPQSTHNLGERERLLRMKKWVDRDKLDNISANEGSQLDGSLKRKARWSLQKMTSSRWKDSMLKASSLRNSLLSLSQKNIEECNGVGTHSGEINQSLAFYQHGQCHSSQSHSLKSLQQWATSFCKLDPRWQIRKFFNDMSVFGTVLSDLTKSDHSHNGAAIFSVWRPTSADAIAKMMRGDGVGKGLEIKGKSAKRGGLSGYIPFLQIHEEEHKKQIRTIPKGDHTKIFFKSPQSRDQVGKYLGTIAKELTLRVAQAKFALARAKFGCDPNVILREELNYAAKTLSYELENPKVVQNDDYAPGIYCIEVSCRVLWEGLVERKDITRPAETNFDTGRASQPAFQDMNFSALKRHNCHEPHPVLYQTSEEDPFDARMLVMAYEEEGKVVPVVSDFDCFLIGSRNFSYEDPMSVEQVELLDWCVSQIEWILDNHTGPESWTTRWLEVLKYAARNGFYPSMPRFGFGDPTSYSMIEASVHRSAKTCGAVRHGPECFNFFFPQEIDNQFLIIFPGSQMWKYVNEDELLDILHQKVREGFTFPLNPKWLLCDPGWISLFEDLLHSSHPSVRDSIDLWFPPGSGLRERILDISRRFPSGFQRDDREYVSPSLAEEEYKRYLILQRARRKMRGFIYWRNLLLDVRQRATASVNANCRGTIEEFQFLCNVRKNRLSAETDDIEDETIKEIHKLDFFGRNDNHDKIEF